MVLLFIILKLLIKILKFLDFILRYILFFFNRAGDRYVFEYTGDACSSMHVYRISPWASLTVLCEPGFGKPVYAIVFTVWFRWILQICFNFNCGTSYIIICIGGSNICLSLIVDSKGYCRDCINSFFGLYGRTIWT